MCSFYQAKLFTKDLKRFDEELTKILNKCVKNIEMTSGTNNSTIVTFDDFIIFAHLAHF